MAASTIHTRKECTANSSCMSQSEINLIYLQRAVEKFCNHPVSVVGCSRTDSGVHALNFVAHVDLQKKPDSQGVVCTVNNIVIIPVTINFTI